MLLAIALTTLESYLLGSIPNGYIAGKISGIDVTKHGSGNIGATNVLRVLGKTYGYSVFFADAFKGFLAVRIALGIAAATQFPVAYAEYLGIAAAFFSVFGHTFPVWLGFKGGKGVATSAGAICGLMPLAALTIFLVWLLVFKLTRYVSIASTIAALALPVTVGFLLKFGIVHGLGLFYFSLAMALLVVWSHRANFSRLAAGTESRFERK